MDKRGSRALASIRWAYQVLPSLELSSSAHLWNPSSCGSPTLCSRLAYRTLPTSPGTIQAATARYVAWAPLRRRIQCPWYGDWGKHALRWLRKTALWRAGGGGIKPPIMIAVTSGTAAAAPAVLGSTIAEFFQR